MSDPWHLQYNWDKSLPRSVFWLSFLWTPEWWFSYISFIDTKDFWRIILKIFVPVLMWISPHFWCRFFLPLDVTQKSWKIRTVMWISDRKRTPNLLHIAFSEYRLFQVRLGKYICFNNNIDIILYT